MCSVSVEHARLFDLRAAHDCIVVLESDHRFVAELSRQSVSLDDLPPDALVLSNELLELAFYHMFLRLLGPLLFAEAIQLIDKLLLLDVQPLPLLDCLLVFLLTKLLFGGEFLCMCIQCIVFFGDAFPLRLELLQL